MTNQVNIIEADELYLTAKIFQGTTTKSGVSWDCLNYIDKIKFKNQKELTKFVIEKRKQGFEISVRNENN